MNLLYLCIVMSVYSNRVALQSDCELFHSIKYRDRMFQVFGTIR